MAGAADSAAGKRVAQGNPATLAAIGIHVVGRHVNITRATGDLRPSYDGHAACIERDARSSRATLGAYAAAVRAARKFLPTELRCAGRRRSAPYRSARRTKQQTARRRPRQCSDRSPRRVNCSRPGRSPILPFPSSGRGNRRRSAARRRCRAGRAASWAARGPVASVRD